MHSLIHTLLGWPNGITTGNLIASAMTGLPAHVLLHVRLTKLHRSRAWRITGKL